jgi:hypothetical protein
MRFVLACLIALGFMVGSSGVIEPTMATNDYVVAAQQQPSSGQVDVDIRADRDADWWASPFWIGVGVVALIIVLIAVITMASRGGRNIVIKG